MIVFAHCCCVKSVKASQIDKVHACKILVCFYFLNNFLQCYFGNMITRLSDNSVRNALA